MPTVPIYLDDELYGKVAILAKKEQIGIGKTIQLIVKSYIQVQEDQGRI